MTRPSAARSYNHPFGRGQTAGTVLARNRGIGPGFDLVRIALAVAIFAGHAKWISGGAPSGAVSALADGAFHLPGLGRLKIVLLPMFFALSGILIMGSAARIRSPSTFLAHRVLRIFPALVVEIALSAFVLGPLLTSLPLRAYFADPLLLRYLGNCLGLVSFELPGLFLSNPVPEFVNINLGTLPFELHCYVITLALMITGLLFRRELLTVAFAIATAALAVHAHLSGTVYPHNIYGDNIIVYYFFAGIVVFQWRDRIPVRTDLAILVAFVGFATIMFDSLTYVSPVFVTVTVLYIGLIPFPRVPVVSGGDYSYGIYLYGFPITQTVLRIAPGLAGHVVLVSLVAGSATLAFAVASWHLVERRVLGLRRRLPKTLFPSARPDATVVPG